MRHVAGPRRELGVRTVFNVLGPLTNPAGATRQVLGVFDAAVTELLAQALRELGPDQYAVFVVRPDGEMELRPVEVRLMDFVNAEIISGLELGEIVSMGVEESTETEVPEQLTPPSVPGMRMFGG